jgi:integrase
MSRPSGLRVEPRRSKATGKTDGFTIVGSVSGLRIRRRAQSNDAKLARKEAAVLEAEILNTAWHGERRGARAFAEAALSYLDAAPRSPRIKAQIGRLLRALGDVKLGQVNQQTATDLKRRMLQPEATAATYVREVVMPLRAILNHAHKLDWCEVPHFTVPRMPQGRTLYQLPAEVDHLIAAAAPHLRPLLMFLVGTGARMSEALELDWADVDLVGARAIFWRTKNGKRRNAHLPPAVVAALTNLPHREGRVFRWATRTRKDGTARRIADYADRERRYGGQIKTAWAGALRRAGLNPELTPHDLRHTWASWHYALNRDLLALKIEGGWSSVSLCERYAHLLPAGQETAIQRFFGHLSGIGVEAAAARG